MFRSGEIKVVCNVGILTVGFDFPELDCVVIARPIRSLNLYYQICGRSCRPHPEKEVATIIDICGNFKRFGRIEAFEVVRHPDTGLYRLQGENGPLTGFDFITNTDLEEKPKPGDEITFGKHKGQKIKDLPLGYVEWCAENLKGQWKDRMKEELVSRGKK